MPKLRYAQIEDLLTIAHIHKAAYSRSHFTALLPDEVLMRYYSYFVNDGSDILLAVDSKGGRCDEILGFAVFGFGIPGKIAKFKFDHRIDILYASLRHPLIASRKLLGTLISRRKFDEFSTPTDFLLLSIAVVTPRQGVGRQLLNAMLDISKKKGCKAAGLYVNANNSGAINTYFSAGFSISSYLNDQFYMEKVFK